jgi:hypothetical protein
MNALELLRRVADERTLSIDLLHEIDTFIKRPPTAVNVMLHGAQVISVMGPFDPVEAGQYAKIAASVGGVRITTIRMDYPSKKKS